MSKVLKIAAGVGLIALGALTGGIAFLPGTMLAFTVGSSTLIALGLSVISSTLLTPKIGGSEQRQASETTLQLGEYPRQVLFGDCVTAGSLLDAFNYGGKYGTDWEVLMIALADHECEELVGFYVNDDYKTFAGNGDVAGYKSQLKVHFLPGTETQSWPSFVTANGPGWSATSHNCAGVACVAVAYKSDDPESETPVWPGGRPRFVWRLKGKKCYNPSLDSTVTGGSGTHRYNDPTTWEWTDNANVCRYQYQRGIYALDRIDQPDQLLIGRGLSEIEAPPERAIAHTATCDELVEGVRRYTFNGLIGADEEFLVAEGYFATAMGGVIRQPDGSIEVEPGQAKAVVAEITDLDILNMSEVVVEPFRGEDDREWLNTVIPRYVEPAQKWKMHAASIRRDYADVIADGGQRTDTLELKHVTVEAQAQRLGEIRRRLGRLPFTCEIPLGPRFAELEEGDWIGWTSARHFQGARKVFRIESYNRGENWHMQLSLREISASAYGWNDATDNTPQSATNDQQAAPPAIGAPGSGAWAVLGGQVEGVKGSLPALFLSGASDDNRAEAIRVEYRVSGTTTWRLAGDFAPAMTEQTITGVADATAYEVSVRYLVDGEPGARLVLPTATTGSISTASGARRIASRTVAWPLTSDDTSIDVAAFDGVLFDGSAVSFPADTADMTGLTGGVTYGVFYDPVAGTYQATAAPSLTEMANKALIFVGAQATSDGGTYPEDDPPPPGGGTGGGTIQY